MRAREQWRKVRPKGRLFLLASAASPRSSWQENGNGMTTAALTDLLDVTDSWLLGSVQGDKGHPKILALTVVSRSVPDREWSPTRSPCDITSSRSRQRHHLPLSTLTRTSSTSDSIIRSRTTPSRQAAARATSAVRFGKVGRVHGVVQHVRAYVATNNPEKQIAVSVATSSCRLTNTRG